MPDNKRVFKFNLYFYGNFSSMIQKTIVKITVAGALMLFFIGICLYFFCKLQTQKEGAETDLYAFVPKDCAAIIETGKINNLISDIADFQQTAHTPSIPDISPLFTLLKQNFTTKEGKALSNKIDKILISFHAPEEDNKNQIIYCRLISSVTEQTESLIGNVLSPFPAKKYNYKGKEIIIYPLKDTEFIACYATDGFLAMSYQKRLIEEVIDTQLSGKSILKDKSFTHSKDRKRINSTASFYVRYPRPDKWTEFDIKLGDKTIYISGICEGNDKKQEMVEIPSDKIIPRYTAYMYQDESSQDSIFPGNNIHCLFYSNETAKQLESIDYMPIKDIQEAEKIKAVMRTPYFYKTTNKWHTIYTFKDKYACFYSDGLLIAPKDSCIYNYIRNMENEDTLELNCPYQQMLSNVNEKSNTFLFANLNDMLSLPSANTPQIPEFFFRYKEYFKHFIMTTQFIYYEGKLSLNIVLYSITKPS